MPGHNRLSMIMNNPSLIYVYVPSPSPTCHIQICLCHMSKKVYHDIQTQGKEFTSPKSCLFSALSPLSFYQYIYPSQFLWWSIFPPEAWNHSASQRGTKETLQGCLQKLGSLGKKFSLGRQENNLCLREAKVSMWNTLSMRRKSGRLTSREKGKKQIRGRPEKLISSDSPYLPGLWAETVAFYTPFYVDRVVEWCKREWCKVFWDKLLCPPM